MLKSAAQVLRVPIAAASILILPTGCSSTAQELPGPVAAVETGDALDTALHPVRHRPLEVGQGSAGESKLSSVQ